MTLKEIENLIHYENILPSSDNAVAHMLPSDLEKFKFGEHVAQAYSIAVGNANEKSVPLFTLEQVQSAIEAERVRVLNCVEVEFHNALTKFNEKLHPYWDGSADAFYKAEQIVKGDINE